MSRVITFDLEREIKSLAGNNSITQIAGLLNINYHAVRGYLRRKNIRVEHGNKKVVETGKHPRTLPSAYVIPGVITSQLTLEQIKAMKQAVDQPSLELIKSQVCEYLSVNRDYFEGSTRIRKFVWARHVYFFLAFNMTTHTLLEIGNMDRVLDHTTVRHGIIVVGDIIETDKDKEREVRELAGVIKNLMNGKV